MFLGKNFKWVFAIVFGASAAAAVFVGAFLTFTDDQIEFVPTSINQPVKFRRLLAVEQMELFTTAIENFKMDMGRFPSNEEGLRALVSKPHGLDKWYGPYFPRDKIPLDPWGNPYIYKLVQEDHYRIFCLGADGREGGTKEDKDVMVEK